MKFLSISLGSKRLFSLGYAGQTPCLSKIGFTAKEKKVGYGV